MKTIFLFMIGTWLATIAFAQVTPEEYLSRIPSLPKEGCDADPIMIENFKSQVIKIQQQLEEDLQNRRQKQQAASENNEANIREGVMHMLAGQYGFSPAELANMENLSNEDMEALAFKHKMHQMNISLDEVKSLQNLNDAGKKAYAEAYPVELKTVAKASPALQMQGQDKTVTLMKLTQEQYDLGQKNAAKEEKMRKRYEQLENDPEGRLMLDKMNHWHSQWSEMVGINYGQGSQMDSLALLIRTEQKKYCERFTPQLWAILNEDLTGIRASVKDYLRFEEVTREIMKHQSGFSMPEGGSGNVCIEVIKQYLERLHDAYSFKLDDSQ
jgi:hypothetical protein